MDRGIYDRLSAAGMVLKVHRARHADHPVCRDRGAVRRIRRHDYGKEQAGLLRRHGPHFPESRSQRGIQAGSLRGRESDQQRGLLRRQRHKGVAHRAAIGIAQSRRVSAKG